MTKVTSFPKKTLKNWNEERARRVYDRARILIIAYNMIEFDKEADQANWSSYQRELVVSAIGGYDFEAHKPRDSKTIRTVHGELILEFWVVQTAVGQAIAEENEHGKA